MWLIEDDKGCGYHKVFTSLQCLHETWENKYLPSLPVSLWGTFIHLELNLQKVITLLLLKVLLGQLLRKEVYYRDSELLFQLINAEPRTQLASQQRVYEKAKFLARTMYFKQAQKFFGVWMRFTGRMGYSYLWLSWVITYFPVFKPWCEISKQAAKIV